MFGSALLRCEGVRGFGFGIGCSGVIQMARDGRRQVGVGRIGVGTVTVVTVDPNMLDWQSWGCWWLLVSSSLPRRCAAVVSKNKKKKQNKKDNTYLLGWPRYAGSAKLGVLVAIGADLRHHCQ